MTTKTFNASILAASHQLMISSMISLYWKVYSSFIALLLSEVDCCCGCVDDVDVCTVYCRGIEVLAFLQARHEFRQYCPTSDSRRACHPTSDSLKSMANFIAFLCVKIATYTAARFCKCSSVKQTCGTAVCASGEYTHVKQILTA